MDNLIFNVKYFTDLFTDFLKSFTINFNNSQFDTLENYK